MTNAEIYRDWKQAKNPKEQVTIIADMEFRSNKSRAASVIMEQCELNGEDVPLYIKQIAGVDISEDLKALAEQGLTQQIADEFGVKSHTIYNWLRKAGIKTKNSGKSNTDKFGQNHIDPGDVKIHSVETAPIVEMASVIAKCAAQLGKGEIIISAYPNESCDYMGTGGGL